MQPQPLNVLLVEDTASDRRTIRDALQKELDVPFRCHEAQRLSEALAALAAQPIDIVLLDLQLPDSQGLEAITRVRHVAPEVPIVVLTASDDDGLAIQALQRGAQDYLVKGYVQVYRNLLRRSMRYAIERTLAEAELRQAHQQNEQVLASITSLLIGVSPDGFITHWNAVAESIFGAAPPEMVGQPLAHERLTWDTPRVLRGIQECRASRASVRLDDIAFKRHRGAEGLLGLTITPMRNAKNELTGYLLFGADVTDRKLAEEALRESEARYRSVIAAMAEGVLLQNADGRIQACNASAERILGLAATDLLERTVLDSRWQAIREDGSPFPGEAHPAMITLRTGRPCSGVVMGIPRADGTVAWISINSQPLFRPGASKPAAVVSSFSEITEHKRVQEERQSLQGQLAQAQKMETVGRFAGGIAHDFENFLQVILGFAWMIRSRNKDDAELMNDLQEIVHAAESASGMVRQLLAFSRRQALRPTILEMNRTIEQMQKLLEQLVGEAIQVHLELAKEPLLVKLDPTAFEQIVMNLCSNARDSMRQGGRLTVRTALVGHPDAAFCDAHPEMAAASLVRLSVSDTGQGMDPSIAAHIFEPFFTTKRTGQGTGLGLAVVYGLVRQHDGCVDVETAPGHGTTFHVYVAHQTITAAPTRSEPPPAAAPAKPAMRVFLADAEERQRALVGDILRESGYRLVGSADGGRLVEQATRCAEPPQLLVLSNELLEGDEGLERVRRLQALLPQAKILLLSGRRDERLRALTETLPGIHLLRTPFVPTQLLEAIRLLVEAPAAPAAPSPAEGNGKPRVLVVDDDDAIRRLCHRILQTSCQVVTVPSGREALDALGAQSYDLLLTDLKMPEMDGFELIERALKRRPALKILAMSGLMTREIEQRLRAGPVACDALRKPFTATALEEAVRRCL